MFFCYQQFKETSVEVLLDCYCPRPYQNATSEVGHLPPVKCSRHLPAVKRPLPVTCPLVKAHTKLSIVY